MNNKNYHIAIIGGKGQMGQLISNYIKQQSNHKLTLIDKDDRVSDYKIFDLVLISVPIDITASVIKEVAPLLSEDTILCDFTSIKEKPLELMLKYHKGPTLGLHPMFGPTITNSRNQVIVHCPGRNQEQYQWFLDLLHSFGFTLESLSAEEHDMLMNFIQGIEHFSTFCLGSFLNQQGVNLNQLLKLASPVYQMELNIVGRLFNQSAELYADIIASDEKRIQLLEDYANHVKETVEYLKAKKRDQFINTFNDVKKSMGSFCKAAYEKTDRSLCKG
ncbi:bifunctional chorismate mutase/prephenate dehydrogenase [Thiotrichales bacterium 19S9-12]|nr:bifunctional chorismate mutase/prephenate dehydrogenase [Thiotrichales bacterium 19S9-11]MCF6811159.1 bifunctional chorismate mutase/prephenate dehydrogenase [Thiotrichales bacterium 19S9-12]